MARTVVCGQGVFELAYQKSSQRVTFGGVELGELVYTPQAPRFHLRVKPSPMSEFQDQKLDIKGYVLPEMEPLLRDAFDEGIDIFKALGKLKELEEENLFLRKLIHDLREERG